MLELEELVYEVANEGRKKRILDRVSGVFQPGELVVITGRNGSGKSTLAQLIMGIKKPTSGRIVWDGQEITNLSITERARLGLALAFQQPVKLKGVTVYNLIDLALGGGADPRDIKKYLEMVGLMPAEYLDREIDNGLSGGELKRIEIASVLARQARVMILDEPEAGIDLWSFDNLTAILKRVHQEDRQKIILVISHQEKILNLADRVVLLKAGKIENYSQKLGGGPS
ncbi:ATP-binding cassette domain-containing protein [Candidatus Saccharibacteria bacterium]|nr:ATP-binding cassette domain-containing protein [Candidatus Saccharibacteria bacterium]